MLRAYIDAAGIADDRKGWVFRTSPGHNAMTLADTPMSQAHAWRMIRRRATAATNALDHQADIAKVHEWLGHANIATTRIYDHRRMRPEDRPTFKAAY
jgi:integrase